MAKSNSSSAKRYAVVSRSTMKAVKLANTREEAREWKRTSGKNGLGIFDYHRGEMIS